MEINGKTRRSSNEDDDSVQIYSCEDYTKWFDPGAYLNHFYSSKANQCGTRLSLFALPLFARLIREQVSMEQRRTLLDVGAGPTIYTAICFRDTVERIHLADYMFENLHRLRSWTKGDEDKHRFDWSGVIQVIAKTEGMGNIEDTQVEQIEEVTRWKVLDGAIEHCDVRCANVLTERNERQQFDVIVSIFCLESVCNNYESYCQNMNNIVNLVRPGGRFILGSVIKDNAYQFGKGNRFELLYLTDRQIVDAMGKAGINIDKLRMHVLEDEGVTMIMGIKGCE